MSHVTVDWEERALGVDHEDYPTLLSEIDDPPDPLHLKGSPPQGPTLAIVGSRKATTYGLGLALTFARATSNAGWNVVSGLALGVDGAAHRGSLEGGSPGMAVLGTGTDVWYPRRHAELGTDLLSAGGAVCSEYPPGTKPRPWHFPARNRIIAGLSLAVLVIEAAERSGALITARLAAEQGREVFVVPGDVDRPNSVGCNKLLRDGAHPVLDTPDLMEALGRVVAFHPRLVMEEKASLVDPTESAIVAELTNGSAAIDDLVVAHGPGALALVGRMELEGRCVVSGGRVQLTKGTI
ncbi:MAG: DNA-protecting protein DprA [Acidimicrobiia bacterium]|nr:DNA-protecting protein DprA [Acidimicrobiia bacterium]